MLAKYSDYDNVFSFLLVIEMPKNTNINKHFIELIEKKQLSYRLIFALNLVKLEIPKDYIKTYLKTGFIQPSKSLIGTSIIFDKKPNNSFCLCVDYQGFNNLTIKNRYLLLLIGKTFLDW